MIFCFKNLILSKYEWSIANCSGEWNNLSNVIYFQTQFGTFAVKTFKENDPSTSRTARAIVLILSVLDRPSVTPWTTFSFFVWRTNFFLDGLKFWQFGKNEVLEILPKSSWIFDIECVKIQLFVAFLEYIDQYASYERAVSFATKPVSWIMWKSIWVDVYTP